MSPHPSSEGTDSLPTREGEASVRWRKRPIVIEAVQVTAADFNGSSWDGSPFSIAPAPEWLIDALEAGIIAPDTPNHTDYAEWRIKTLEGEMLAGPGDWIIRGIKGELYPCKPDIFAATYEPADTSSPNDLAREASEPNPTRPTS